MKITIVGAGSIGRLLAQKLNLDDHEITVIEKDKEMANYANDHLDVLVLHGDGTDLSFLRKSKVEKAEVFASLTTNDGLNMISCQLAKKLGVKYTIARVRNSQYLVSDEFHSGEMGVDLFVHPEYETAQAIARLLRQSAATDIIEMDGGKLQFMGLRIEDNAKFLHTPFKEFNENFGDLPMRIVAVKRRTRTIIPRGDDLLIPGDQIFFTCDAEYKEEILNIFGKEDVQINNIMIVGGGMIGKFTALALQDSMNVKIIEQNKDKAQSLAEILDNSLVIMGDGSDLDLLHQEGLTEMDEIITVTGDDETNIITATVATHLEVSRTVTLINKNEYIPLISALNLDAVVSKQHLTVNAIRNYIRKSTISQFNELPGLDAIIVEFIASEKSKIVGKKLKKLKFPKRALMGAIVRKNGDIVIPQGETVINPDDKVVVFCEPETFPAVEKLF